MMISDSVLGLRATVYI